MKLRPIIAMITCQHISASDLHLNSNLKCLYFRDLSLLSSWFVVFSGIFVLLAEFALHFPLSDQEHMFTHGH